eukprot:403340455
MLIIIGEYGTGKLSKKKLHYLGCKVHRIVEDFVIQAGDIVSMDGSGGESIYGKFFNDENFTRRHAHGGLLSMANHGRNTNSSQFFITLKPCPHLDGKHVVFGQVVEGMDVIRAISKVPTDMYEKPRIPVHIFDCGQIGGNIQEKLNREQTDEPSAVEEFMRLRDEKEKAKLIQAQGKSKVSTVGSSGAMKQLEEQKNGKDQKDGEVEDEEEEDDPEAREQLEKLKAQSKSDKIAQKKLDLLMKMNEARKLNNKAVVDEQERMQEGGYLYEKRRNKEEFWKDKKQLQSELDKQGFSKDKAYAFDTAVQAEKTKKKKGKNMTFGWDVFNDDTLYRAYFKRTNKIGGSKPAAEDPNITQQEKISLMAQDVENQIEKRSEFKRQRMFIDDKDIDYINDRNRVFNEKLDRNFGKYAAEIKQNIETGHAL